MNKNSLSAHFLYLLPKYLLGVAISIFCSLAPYKTSISQYLQAF
jgi:hypothetical protein